MKKIDAQIFFEKKFRDELLGLIEKSYENIIKKLGSKE